MFITVVSRIVNNIIIIKYLLVQLSILFERTPYKVNLAELLSVPTKRLLIKYVANNIFNVYSRKRYKVACFSKYCLLKMLKWFKK